MVQIAGINRDELDKLGDDFTAHVVLAIRATLRTVAADVSSKTTVDDLGVISTRWTRRVDDTLISDVGAAYWSGVSAVHDQVVTHLTQVAAGVPNPAGELDDASAAALDFEIPHVTNELVEQYLVGARNRLVSVGNDVWEIVRGLLIEGMQSGEGVRDIALRITSATGIVSSRAEVIARTEINAAANAAGLAQVRALRLEGTKTWEAVGDERTRPWHRDADGQTVDITEKFMVGGEAMDQPLDGAGSAGNVVNCRCTASFDVLDNSLTALEPDTLVAGAGAETSAMLALVPSDEHLDRLAFDGGEPRDQLHCTLHFLGDVSNYTPEQRTSLEANVRSYAATMAPITAYGFGVNHWNPGGDSPSWNLAVGEIIDDEGFRLTNAWDASQKILHAAGVIDNVPAQHTPWSPHVCMAYSADTKLIDKLVASVGPIHFDRLRMAFANEVIDVPLGPVGSGD